MKNFIKNSVIASMVAVAITACGGGGSSGGNNNGGGETKAALSFTPVADVAAVVGTQGIQLAQVRKSSGIDFISSAYADDISTTVSLAATDVSGNTFNVGFIDVEGNPASETVTPSGMVRLDDDHVMVELFVLTNASTNLHEYRHYVVEYSTGKMILVETLADIGNAWMLNAQYYAAGPNSLHNATNDIIYRKEDTKWYKLTPNWDDLTFTETAYADSTGWADQDMVSTLPTANGNLFTVSGNKVYLNGTDLGLGYVISVFQKGGEVYANTSNQMYNITTGTPVEYASLPEGAISIGAVIAFDGTNVYTSECTSINVNGNSMEYTYIPADHETVSYDVVMAGSDMMCNGHPRPTEPAAASSKMASKISVRAAANDFTGNDAACDRAQSWEQNGGVQLVRVSGNVEQRVEGALGSYKILPMSRDSAYMSQFVCTPTGGDGVTSAKWELTYADTKVDFANNELSALPAPVVMSVVN